MAFTPFSGLNPLPHYLPNPNYIPFEEGEYSSNAHNPYSMPSVIDSQLQTSMDVSYPVPDSHLLDHMPRSFLPGSPLFPSQDLLATLQTGITCEHCLAVIDDSINRSRKWQESVADVPVDSQSKQTTLSSGITKTKKIPLPILQPIPFTSPTLQIPGASAGNKVYRSSFKLDPSIKMFPSQAPLKQEHLESRLLTSDDPASGIDHKKQLWLLCNSFPTRDIVKNVKRKWKHSEVLTLLLCTKSKTQATSIKWDKVVKQLPGRTILQARGKWYKLNNTGIVTPEDYRRLLDQNQIFIKTPRKKLKSSSQATLPVTQPEAIATLTFPSPPALILPESVFEASQVEEGSGKIPQTKVPKGVDTLIEKYLVKEFH